MNRNLSRVLALLLLCMMLVSLWGCDSNPKDTTPTVPPIDYSSLDFKVDMSKIPVGNVSSLLPSMTPPF